MSLPKPTCIAVQSDSRSEFPNLSWMEYSVQRSPQPLSLNLREASRPLLAHVSLGKSGPDTSEVVPLLQCIVKFCVVNSFLCAFSIRLANSSLALVLSSIFVHFYRRSHRNCQLKASDVRPRRSFTKIRLMLAI